MRNGIIPVATDVDDKRAWVPTLSDEETDNPMKATTWRDDRAKYWSDTDVRVTISESKIKYWILISE